MPSYPTPVANAKMDAVVAYAQNAALFRIYSGTVPANSEAALSGNTVLSSHTMGSPIAPAAASRAVTLTLPSNVTAIATGTATFARLLRSDGTTVVAQFTLGTSGAEVIVSTTSFISGGNVQVTAGSLAHAPA